MSVIDKNKAIARRFLEFIETTNVDEMCKMISPNWKMFGGPPALPSGPEGIKKLFSTFGHIDQKWTVEDIIAEGDKVVIRATNTCEQDSFFGILASGRQQIFTAMFILHIEDGKILKIWRNADDLGWILRLGASLMPAN